MELVEVTVDDLDLLVEISRRTFFNAFQNQNSPANMSAYMDQAFTHDKLLGEIRNRNSKFYFAKDGNATVGYLKINRSDAQTEFKDDSCIEIERIYIEQEHQGKGCGTFMLNEIKKIAVSEGIRFIWLGVWEKNPGAIRFYARHGFDMFSSHEFVMGNEVQIDKLMVFKL